MPSARPGCVRDGRHREAYEQRGREFTHLESQPLSPEVQAVDAERGAKLQPALLTIPPDFGVSGALPKAGKRKTFKPKFATATL